MTLRADDMKVGQWVAVSRSTEMVYGPFGGSTVEDRMVTGVPMQIVAISLPWICVRVDGRRFPIDTRICQFQLLHRSYVNSLKGIGRSDGPFVDEDEVVSPSRSGGGCCPMCGERLVERLTENANGVWEGLAIERYREMIIKQHVKNAYEVDICGHSVLGCYCSAGEIISEVAQELAKGRPFGVCWFDLSNGGERVYSLRSLPDGIDVSEVAKKMGGGGHKHAAGFKVPVRTLIAGNMTGADL